MSIELLFGVLISSLGTIILILIHQVLNTINEIKQEIKILQNLEQRITRLEEFREHFAGCINFKR
jgi:hypothetical protein